ncbi:hypothetical protein BTN50_1382 [Candidatus Enterovibrio altilux]|uniref:Uncharacterized protein n=1 Tax=Candidatus Enterovibrio altilux TaxID=1927128 RepID=A0A291BA36_9GAMM|nr:hypothetical protein BTN50_1382 [Candidatus Enterovibrio luxaltus]
MIDSKVLPNLFNQLAEKLTKYQPTLFSKLNNIIEPFILNEQFHSSHQEKEQVFEAEVIRVI